MAYQDKLLKTKKGDLCYIAGLFDGEGCIQIVKNKKRKRNSIEDRLCFVLRVSIGNTDLGLLESVKKNIGMGTIIFRRKPREGSNFKSYSYRVSDSQAFIVLKKLIPFLRSKKEEAILGIEFQETKKKGRYCRRYPLTKLIILKREKMCLKMRSLKRARRTPL